MLARSYYTRKKTAFFVIGIIFAVFSNTVYAHCDTLNGPVVQTARMALEDGNLTPLLKWIQPGDEDEIRDAFRKTRAVRAMGGEARELADRYFFETVVRVHRAGEGAPYTGLKSGEDIDPAVLLADEALESGTVDELVDVLTEAMANGIQEKFRHTVETQAHADDSVEQGREFVEAYVIFTHYVEEIHSMIKGDSVHHIGGG